MQSWHLHLAPGALTPHRPLPLRFAVPQQTWHSKRIGMIARSIGLGLLMTRVVTAAESPAHPLPHQPGPAYPEAAHVRQVEGEVAYRASIDAEGHVRSVEILGVPVLRMGFEEAVREALAAWRFEPARRDGQPVAGRYEGKIDFTLTYSTSRARIYERSFATLWAALVEALQATKTSFAVLDQQTGVAITRWRPYSGKHFPGLSLGEGPERFVPARLQISAFTPPWAEPGRLYLGSIIESRNAAGKSLMTFNVGLVERWLYEQVERRIQHAGQAIPRTPSKRQDLARKFRGELPSDTCTLGPLFSLLSSSATPGTQPNDASFPKLIPSTKFQPLYADTTGRPGFRERVIVDAVINEDGWISEVGLGQPADHAELAVSAAQSVTFWRYEPATWKGCAVPVKLKVVADFNQY